MFSRFTISCYEKGRNLVVTAFWYLDFYISLEIEKKDTECSNGAQAQRRVCPKAYAIRRRATFGQRKRNTFFRKTLRFFFLIKLKVNKPKYKF